MSVKQMALVWELDLPANKKFILLAYADHADEDGEHVFPSLGRIAHKTGYSRDQVRRISKDLKDAGLMELVKDATPTQAAEYRLLLEGGGKLPPLRKRGVANDPPRVGANDPSRVGAPVLPEPSVEPSVNHHVESKDSSGKPQNKEKVKPIGLEKDVTDRIYKAMRDNDTRLPNEHYTYHLGRAKDMIAKDNPTDAELEELPDAFVRHWTLLGRTDAPNALNELRRQRKRAQLIADSRSEQDDRRRYGEPTEIDEAKKEDWARQRAELAEKEHQFLKEMGLVK
jgi:hypothetical protein